MWTCQIYTVIGRMFFHVFFDTQNSVITKRWIYKNKECLKVWNIDLYIAGRTVSCRTNLRSSVELLQPQSGGVPDGFTTAHPGKSRHKKWWESSFQTMNKHDASLDLEKNNETIQIPKNPDPSLE